jgi:heme-degrading monooxygenase HmoA
MGRLLVGVSPITGMRFMASEVEQANQDAAFTSCIWDSRRAAEHVRLTIVARKDGTVIGVSVVFDYQNGLDRHRVIEVAKNARKMFEGLPGLRFKFFTLDDKRQQAMNFYVWESTDAAEAFFTDELRERVTGLYGVSPTISFLEIAEVVDNRHSGPRQPSH